MVLYVANIHKSKNKDTPNSFILELCDGHYIMSSYVTEKNEHFDCDKVLTDMIKTG